MCICNVCMHVYSYMYIYIYIYIYIHIYIYIYIYIYTCNGLSYLRSIHKPGIWASEDLTLTDSGF